MNNSYMRQGSNTVPALAPFPPADVAAALDMRGGGRPPVLFRAVAAFAFFAAGGAVSSELVEGALRLDVEAWFRSRWAV